MLLDSLSPILRHLALMVLATGASWAGTDLVPFLQGQPGYGALAGTLAVAFLAWATPWLTQQYGVGSGKRASVAASAEGGV